jgi:hypothetical protein
MHTKCLADAVAPRAACLLLPGAGDKVSGLKAGIRTVAWLAVTLAFACKMSPDAQYVREKFPMEIQGGNPIEIKIHSLSGNGWNEVGIRCSAETWAALAKEKSSFRVRLVTSDRSNTKIINVSPGAQKLWPVDSFHYLFSIGGDHSVNATVEMAFGSAISSVRHAEILVLKTPADTGP